MKIKNQVCNPALSLLSRTRGLGRAWSLSPGLIAMLALSAPQLTLAAPAGGGWESPFQAGRPDFVRDALVAVPAGRCDRDPHNRCTFEARVDYDRDGAADIVRMVDGREIGALVVEFAGRKRRPLTIASFRGAWTGSCYIEPDSSDRSAVSLICPEASAATFKMRNGRPAVRWAGD